jgi:hypothetical protein
MEDLPIDVIELFLNDNITLINMCMLSKNFNIQLTSKLIKNKKQHYYILDCLKRGNRYKKMIDFYNKITVIDGVDILNFLCSDIGKKEMEEWFILLEKDDVLFENKYWLTGNDEYIANNATVIDKYKSKKYIDNRLNIYEIRLSPKDVMGVKSPALILIPPRTDILID